jgi:hypothetical protein
MLGWRKTETRPIVLEKDVKGVSESQNDVEKQDFILISPANDVLCQVSKPNTQSARLHTSMMSLSCLNSTTRLSYRMTSLVCFTVFSRRPFSKAFWSLSVG